MALIASLDILDALRQQQIEVGVKALYRQYFESITAQICTIGGNREDAADIFQEAVLVLIDKVKTGSYRGESSLKTFLSAIARNLWLQELRSRGRRHQREASYHQMENPVEAYEPRLFGGEVGRVFEVILSQMGDTCKKLLTGFYYEEKSMKEMLADFNYENEQVLRNKKSKCMKGLKDRLEKQPELLTQLKTLSLYES